MEGVWDWKESMKQGNAQIKDVALRAWFSVINSNKNEKKTSFEFGRMDGKVCAGRVLACFVEDKQLLTLGTAGNKGAELLQRLLSVYYGYTQQLVWG